MQRAPFGSVHVINASIYPGFSLEEKTIFGPDPQGSPCIVFTLITVGVNVVLLVVVCETQPVLVVVKLTAHCTAAFYTNLVALTSRVHW